MLFVPIQRGEDVPEGVPGRIEEYLRALIEIDPKIKLSAANREDVDGPASAMAPVPAPAPEMASAAAPAPEAPAPAKPSPEIDRAAKSLTQGREAVLQKKYEKGLPLLMQARDLFAKHLAEIEDFDQYVDSQVWIASGLFEGGYAEEAADAIGKVLAVRPELVVDKEGFSKKFAATVDKARAKNKAGGVLTVKVTPEDATVYVDGRPVPGGVASGRRVDRPGQVRAGR